MNVLVYSGPEVYQQSLQQALGVLKATLEPNYSIQTVTKQVLASHPWTTNCAGLVFPSCQRPFTSTAATENISSYVESGGFLLALSSGTHISRSSNPPASHTELDGSQERPLSFLDRRSGSSLFLTQLTQNPVWVSFKPTDGGLISTAYQRGEGSIAAAEWSVFTELAKYQGDAQRSDQAAAAAYGVGSGKVVVISPGVEFSTSEQPAASLSTADTTPPSDFQRSAQTFVRAVFASSGLHVPQESSEADLHPLPQFLVSSVPTSTSSLTDGLGVTPSASQPKTLKDENDIFQFHTYEDGLVALKNSLQHSDTPHPWQPKHVIVCADGVLPDPTHTPLFSLRRYFEALGPRRHSPTTGAWGIGDILFYGEVVTSTQTMLDKNPRLLSSLPAPLVSLASQQLTGRGRGQNGWLSPPGCLQFSLLLRLSLSSFPASKLVFVQYLTALAIAEATRDERVLGPEDGEKVRLKWPNDLYAIQPDGEKKKIGGILVNTSFSSGKVDIVIGCGINTTNSAPIASLSQLASSGRKLEVEKVLAAILSKFQAMWDTFVEEKGSFDSFMNLYLQRWLHSDQLITLTTVSPPQKVRIVEITSDHGLLRTIPERSYTEAFIDLQPDGNSFDLMAGLIKAKT